MSNSVLTRLKHTRHSRIIVDLEAIRFNYKFLKSIAPESKVIAVIKADAYGHGAVQVAQALPDADAFAVATTLEAIPLREAGVTQKIIILGGPIDESEILHCLNYDLDPVIHQFWQIELLMKATEKKAIDLWLKFNSGMGRLGFSADDLKQALQQLKDGHYRGQIRMMTHLSNADDVSDEKSAQQIELAQSLEFDQYEWGVANSSGILGWPESRVNWVRAGIALYGSDPLKNQRFSQKLKPSMSFKSQVIAINQLKQGQSVGYGATYICSEDKTIAVVAAGYADGYPRHLANGIVVIKGKSIPVVGRVSMDMITLDVTGKDIRVGDEVTLWGHDPLAEEIASLSETISYELFCHAGCHGKREYLG